MTSRRALLLTTLCAALAPSVRAETGTPPELAQTLPGAKLHGSGRMRALGFHICDVRLWVTPGFNAANPDTQPLALELQYARSLSGSRIADRSLSEMRGVGTVPDARADAWLAEMKAAFPDVNKGDRITGVYRPGESARFFVNGVQRREVRDAEFARLFFNIWLSPRTSQPGLRDALLGPGRSTP